MCAPNGNEFSKVANEYANFLNPSHCITGAELPSDSWHVKNAQAKETRETALYRYTNTHTNKIFHFYFLIVY